MIIREIMWKLMLLLVSAHCCQGQQEFPLFHTQPTEYLKGAHNLSTIAELEDFLVTQAAIYIDNVYEVYQRFFYKLLGDLPRSERWQHIKDLTMRMDDYLELDYDLYVKLEKYELFMNHYAKGFATIFEYDANETLLDANEYNDIYVANQVEEVLTYANDDQMREFMSFTGDGLRLYLILNRPRVNKMQLLEFKAVIDRFLESSEFLEKWISLKILLAKLQQVFSR